MPTLTVVCAGAQTESRTAAVRRAIAKFLRSVATRIDGHAGPAVDLGEFPLLGAPERAECLHFAEAQLRKAAQGANRLMFEEFVMQQQHPALFANDSQESDGLVAQHRRV